MANRSLVQTAYQTLQIGKGIAGLAHKEISTKLMELLAPDAVPSTSPISKELINDLRKSIKDLEQIDWKEAEQGLYPKSLLFDAPWMEWLKKYPPLKGKIKSIKTAVLWKKAKSTFNPDFCAVTLKNNPWIVQPFERYEEIRIGELKKKHKKRETDN